MAGAVKRGLRMVTEAKPAPEEYPHRLAVTQLPPLSICTGCRTLQGEVDQLKSKLEELVVLLANLANNPGATGIINVGAFHTAQVMRPSSGGIGYRPLLETGSLRRR